MKTLLVPVDFSPITPPVLAAAVALAKCTAEPRIILVHVTEPEVGMVDYAVATVSIAQVNQQQMKHALSRLTALQSQLAAQQVPAEVRNLAGLPVEEILDLATAESADYIVVGSHGHGAFHDLLLGSTTRGILKRATCPVLIVPAGVALASSAPRSVHLVGRE